MLIIGTSNWAGDYFEDIGTGVAVVLRQIEKGKTPRIFKQIKNLFERDWNSNYAHLLDKYMENCLKSGEKISNEICEKEKDPKLLSNVITNNKTNKIIKFVSNFYETF